MLKEDNEARLCLREEYVAVESVWLRERSRSQIREAWKRVHLAAVISFPVPAINEDPVHT